MTAKNDKMKDYVQKNRKELINSCFFLLLICSYTVSVSLHTLSLLYVTLFITVFVVLIYYRKIDMPVIKTFIFTSFYIWVGYDEKCYIFEDISIYSRFFYHLITLLLGVYLYCRWSGNVKVESKRHLLSAAIVEFVFWGFAILYKVETRTAPVLETIVLAVVFYIWSSELIDASLYLLEIIATRIKAKEEDRRNYRRIWITIFLFLIVIGGLFSILFYPGIITYDTIAIYEAAMNLGNPTVRTDIHSFAYTCFERLVFSICDNFYFLTWILMTAFSAAWASFITNICRLGLNYRIAYMITFVWILVPSNLYMLISTWKDMPFTIFLMITANMLMKISASGDMFQVKVRDYAVLAAGIIGAALSRSNGQFVLLAVVAASMFYAVKRKERRAYHMFKSIVLAGIIVLLIKIPVYGLLQVESTYPGFAAIPFVDGVWENVVYGGEVSDEIVSFIEDDIMPIDKFRGFYEENRMNVYCFPQGTDTIEFDRAKEAWVTCLKNSPFVTLMARLKKTYNLWSVFPRSKIPTATNYVWKIVDGTDLNYLSLPLFEKLRKVFGLCYSDGWLYGTLCFIIARGGWNIFLWIVLGLFLKKKGMEDCGIVIVPAAANTVALLIACCYQDYRYMYPMFVLTVLYMLYVLQICAIREERIL